MLRSILTKESRRLQSTTTTATSKPESNLPGTIVSGETWHETKNRQGRSYYVNSVTGLRQWEHPGPHANVIKLSKMKMPELKTMGEKVTNLLTNSAAAYYGLFFVFCAGLAYRIAYPPKPAPPTVGPVVDK